MRAGTIGSHTLNNSSSTNSGRAEINTLCGLIGGERRWFNLRPEDPGILTINTEGSLIETLLGVFTFGFIDLDPVACDDSGAPDGKTSRVSFTAVPGSEYLIGVDGKGGQTGVIQLNWSLGAPLTARRQGATLRLSWPASFVGFGLEEASSLQGPVSWAPAGLPIPAAVNGTNSVWIPLSQARKFYRLRQP